MDKPKHNYFYIKEDKKTFYNKRKVGRARKRELDLFLHIIYVIIYAYALGFFLSEALTIDKNLQWYIVTTHILLIIVFVITGFFVFRKLISTIDKYI